MTTNDKTIKSSSRKRKDEKASEAPIVHDDRRRYFYPDCDFDEEDYFESEGEGIDY